MSNNPRRRFKIVLILLIFFGVIFSTHVLGQALAPPHNPPPPLTPVQKLKNDIMLAKRNNNTKKASALYQKLLQVAPTPKNLRAAGVFFATIKNLDKAEELWLKSVTDIHTEYSKIERYFYRYGLYNQLLDLFLAIYSNDKLHNRYYVTNRILELMFNLNRFSEIIPFIKANLIKYPGMYRDFMARLLKLAKLKEHQASVIGYLDTIQTNSNLTEAQHIYARKVLMNILTTIGMYDAAIPLFLELLPASKISDWDISNYIRRLSLGGVGKKLIPILQPWIETRIENLLQSDPGMRIIFNYLDLLERENLSLAAVKLSAHFKKLDDYLIKDVALLKHAKLLMQVGEYEEALKTFNSLQSIAPHVLIPLQAQALLWLNRIDKLLQFLQNNEHVKGVGYISALVTMIKGDYGLAQTKLENVINRGVVGTSSDRALDLYEQLLTNTHSDKRFLALVGEFERLRFLESYSDVLAFEKKLVGRFGTQQALYFQFGFIDAEYRLEDYEKLLQRIIKVSKYQLSEFYREKTNFILGKLLIEEFDEYKRGRKILLTQLRRNPKSVFAPEIRKVLSSISNNSSSK
jgi:tetratricopeptide (TPR) repeat protein